MSSLMTGSKERKVWTKILKKYKEMAHLWDKNHPDYKDRMKRKKSMDILLALYKTVEECGNIWMLKKKIENMRTSYYREIKKVKSSRLSVSGCDEVFEYIPKLWYFDLLTFLGAPGEPATPETETLYTQIESDENSIASYNSGGDQSPLMVGSHRSSSSSDKPFEVQFSEDTKCDEFLRILDPLHKSKKDDFKVHYGKIKNEDFDRTPSKKAKIDDECETLGKAIGIQLKNISQEQLVIAQKVISETIFYAQTNKLTVNSRVRLN